MINRPDGDACELLRDFLTKRLALSELQPAVHPLDGLLAAKRGQNPF